MQHSFVALGLAALAVALPAGAAAAASSVTEPAPPVASAAHAARTSAHHAGGAVTVTVPPLLLSKVVRDGLVWRVAGLATTGSPAGRLELHVGPRTCSVALRPGVPGRCALAAGGGDVRAVATSPAGRLTAVPGGR